MKKFLIAIPLAALPLAGCESLDAGTVESKEFTEGHMASMPTTSCINGVCTTQQNLYWVGDDWEITVCVEETIDKPRTCDIWDVSQSYYDSVEVGDQVEKG